MDGLIYLRAGDNFREVDTWTEVEALKGFVPDFEGVVTEEFEPIGAYQLKQWRWCGWASCHQRHNTGAIVRSPEGTVFTIGQDCAKKCLGEDVFARFKELSKLYGDFSQRRRLNEAIAEFPGHRDRLDRLWKEPRGGAWAHGWVMNLTQDSPNVSREIRHALASMVKARSPVFKWSRPANAEEVARMEALGRKRPASPYIHEQVMILGTEALRPEANLRRILKSEVVHILNAPTTTDMNKLSRTQLGRYAREIDSLPVLFDRAVRALSDARALLVRSNLEPLSKAAGSDMERRRYLVFLDELQTAIDGEAEREAA